jgi:hypothetical protein
MPAEKALWQKWLSQNYEAWENYEYDVRVGDGVTYEGPGPDWMPEMVKKLTQKRIDVMAWRQGIPWIFEIKPQAGLSAYGQLLAYHELWTKDNPDKPTPRLAVVTDRLTPDEEYLYLRAGITVFLV